MTVDVVFGLGSNYGDRLAYLSNALILLENLVGSKLVVSKLYSSKALLKVGAASEWDMDFVNLAARAKCSIEPQILLSEIKKIELEIGRVDRGVWAPREIDIDILCYGDQNILEDNLIIPHKELLNRDFALIPLVDIYPDWRYPLEGKFYNKKAIDIVKVLGYESKLAEVSWDS